MSRLKCYYYWVIQNAKIQCGVYKIPFNYARNTSRLNDFFKNKKYIISNKMAYQQNVQFFTHSLSLCTMFLESWNV